ncbi:MAG: PorP/SprF family type IX secretion system membrane protein [Bacteroidales bacterium]|jgi:type IX secretion system PorP/SprF family membrane protein
MNDRKCLSIILLVLLSHLYGVNGQDPSFSQFYFNKLYFNPAFCGLSGGIEANLTDRILWPNIPSKFNTEKFSANMDISNINGLGGVGIIAVSDVEGAGSLKTSQVGLPVSARIKVSDKWFLQAGFAISVMQKSIDWDNFVFSDQFDEMNGIVRSSSFSIPNVSKLIFPDLQTGFVFEYQHSPNTGHQNSSFNTDNASYKSVGKSKWSMRVGFAVDHLTQPDFSFIGGESLLPRKYTGHIDFIFPMSFDRTFIFAPAVVFEQQKDMRTVLLGSNILWRSPFIGIWYRRYENADAIDFTVGMKLGRAFHGYISYSYDCTISGLMRATGGSHEINLAYMIGRRIRLKMIPCPEF